MQFIDACFPLIVAVGAPRFDDDELQRMKDGWQKYFDRDERYATVIVWPRTSAATSAPQRRQIADWVNEPRVQAVTKKLCVGGATVLESALVRGAYTALLWFWTPPFPMRAVSSLTEGIEYGLDRLEAERIPLRTSRQAIRGHLIDVLGAAN